MTLKPVYNRAKLRKYSATTGENEIRNSFDVADTPAGRRGSFADFNYYGIRLADVYGLAKTRKNLGDPLLVTATLPVLNGPPGSVCHGEPEVS